ncbi:NRAMP family divalent metal transporter [Salinibacter grassmerensis]|uniref:NRAMP family divalent metal transporter n=1 Tax=Salinibacter grassmerensis TaxID=3040353 RepID=UPI0021E93303|nr:divalent metal cation transporter [Salinibacter grassmerensis]
MVASYFGSGSVFIMSSAGVRFGYTLVWLVGLAVLIGVMAQDMSARVGIFGHSLGQFTRRKFGKAGATALLGFISIGCVLWGLELTAAVGLGAQILLESALGISVSWMPLAVLTGALAAGTGVLQYRLIEYLMTAMMLVLFVAFGVVAVASDPDPLAVLAGAVPSASVLDTGGLTLAAAILGTTALWPNFFLESLFVEEKGWTGAGDLPDMRLDLAMGYSLGGLASVAIIVATAAVLRPAGITELESFITPGRALTDVLGTWAMLLFLGGTLVAAFNSIVPILWTPAYILQEAWGTRIQSSDPQEAPGSFRALFVGLCLLSGLSPLVHLLGGLSVLDMIVLFPAWNGVFGLPVSAALLFWAVNDREAMGERRNGRWLNGANVALVLLAVGLSVLSARDVVGAIFGGGL